MAPADRSTNRSSTGSEEARVAVRLKRHPGAVGDARSILRSNLGTVLAKETLDDVLIVVSELVTNAVLYGQGDGIALSVACDAQRVTGEVSDQGTGFEQQQHARDPRRVGGNGLFMVGRIADSWGLREGASQVWFEIPARRPN